MAFLRIKRAGGHPYAYLVENSWDARSGQSRQRVLAYLGRLDRVRTDQIPAAHRTPEVLRALESKQAMERDRQQAATERLRERFLAALLRGDPVSLGTLARSAMHDLGEEAFLYEVLVEVMHDLGRRWSRGEVSISQEHLASGVAAGLMTQLNASLRSKVRAGPEVVVCVPEGEYHTLPLLLMERPLLERGYRIVNIGASAPTRSILEFVRDRRPYATLISVTQPECFEAARALARQLHRELPGLRVAIGGHAVETTTADGVGEGVELVRRPMRDYLGEWPSPGTSS